MAKSKNHQRRKFVILEHDHPFLHWDLLVERKAADGSSTSGDRVLASWRLLQPIVPGKWIDTEVLPDHRAMYLDYEGPVSNDRGTVKRIASGVFRAISSATSGSLDFELTGCEIAARASLRNSSSGKPQWRFE